MRIPAADPKDGKWVAYSDARHSKVVAQGDDLKRVINKAARRGVQPPILIMRAVNEDRIVFG